MIRGWHVFYTHEQHKCYLLACVFLLSLLLSLLLSFVFVSDWVFIIFSILWLFLLWLFSLFIYIFQYFFIFAVAANAIESWKLYFSTENYLIMLILLSNRWFSIFSLFLLLLFLNLFYFEYSLLFVLTLILHQSYIYRYIFLFARHCLNTTKQETQKRKTYIYNITHSYCF